MAPDVVEHSIFIRAPRARVREFLIRSDLMTAWMGDRAQLDPVPGGRFAVDVRESMIRGEYVAIEEDRIVFTWGLAGTADLPPGSSTVEVVLADADGGTVVTLTHRDLPPSRTARHREGWSHFLSRLGMAADPSRTETPPPFQPCER